MHLFHLYKASQAVSPHFQSKLTCWLHVCLTSHGSGIILFSARMQTYISQNVELFSHDLTFNTELCLLSSSMLLYSQISFSKLKVKTRMTWTVTSLAYNKHK